MYPDVSRTELDRIIAQAQAARGNAFGKFLRNLFRVRRQTRSDIVRT